MFCLQQSLLRNQLSCDRLLGGKNTNRFALPSSALGKNGVFYVVGRAWLNRDSQRLLQQPGEKPRHRDARDPQRKGTSAPLHTSVNLLANHTGRDGEISSMQPRVAGAPKGKCITPPRYGRGIEIQGERN